MKPENLIVVVNYYIVVKDLLELTEIIETTNILCMPRYS